PAGVLEPPPSRGDPERNSSFASSDPITMVGMSIQGRGMPVTRIGRFFGLVLLAVVLPGCMQTKHWEYSNMSTCNAGECPSASQDSYYKERTWRGFWFGQPARVQP